MYKIVCDFCGNENKFSTKTERPKECQNQACQNSLEGLGIIEEEARPDERKTVGLKLIYQKTSEEIVLQTDVKTILGRQNYGSQVLEKITQVSRAHCSIELVNNKYLVHDLGSTNGTFIGLGADKKDCIETQILNNKDFLVLGKEVFLAQYLKEVELPEKEKHTTIIEEEKTNEPILILCTECSFVLAILPCSCPECGTWNE